MTPPEDASSQNLDALPGKVVAGNFLIGRLIGSGAMGNVYQAEQLSLGKAVAVKVLHPQLMSDDKLVRRFQREAKSASRLNHPNSIQIIDSGQDSSGALYIAMELLSGRDLSQVIRDEFPMPLQRVVRIMSQVLSALDEAHAQGVIHRDLKPGNIMLIERRGEPDFVKVCDYGIAKAQMDDQGDTQMLTVQGLVCGTPEYMSPEQARGEPLDGRTDLYSAAVILYHMVTGDIPFRAATPIGIVSRHLSEVPAVPSARRPDPGIPAELDDLILRGLAKTRDLRPPTAAAFREELEDIGAGRAVRSTRGAEKTVPANQVIADARPTVLLASSRSARPRGRSRRQNAARALAISLVLVASAAAAALVVIKRSRVSVSAPSLAPAATAIAPAAAPATAVAAGAPEGTYPLPGVAEAPEQVAAAAPVVVPSIEPMPAPEPHALENAAGALPLVPPSMKSPRSTAGTRDRPGHRKRDDGHSAATAISGGSGAVAGAAVVAAPSSAASAPSGLPSTPTRPTAPSAASEAAMARLDEKAITTAAPSHGPREIIAEAEKLLAQGEVAEACRRGEEAKKAAPRLAPAHKFLGKCYMRAGDPARAKDNYRRYLEILPNAPDAMFIESIVK